MIEASGACCLSDAQTCAGRAKCYVSAHWLEKFGRISNNVLKLNSSTSSKRAIPLATDITIRHDISFCKKIYWWRKNAEKELHHSHKKLHNIA